MTDYSGTDTTQGKEVKWYWGGAQATETVTVDGTDVSNGYIALAAKAEYGSVQLSVDGTFTGCVEYSDTAGATLATDSAGTQSIKYTGIAESQVLTIYYLDISATTLSQVAMCKDVKTSWKADTKKEPVQGQSNKIQVSGVMEQTATLNSLYYNQTLLNAFCGDQVTDASGNKRWSSKHNAFSEVGALVGKKEDSSGNVVKKWFLYGVTAEGMDMEFNTDDFYKKSFTLLVDDFMEYEPVSS